MNKYSFKDILEKKITVLDESANNVSIVLDRIEIPKIQRDYAQGRTSESEVRIRFLDDIFKTLVSQDEALMEMDFVYGSLLEVEKTNKQNIFTPLDGQQRLTTLFLLYWYVAARELEQTSRDDLNKLLEKFTYETRTSSRRFCSQLTKITILFTIKPSQTIENLPWFFKSYKQDPTIQSMLNMLDAIHEKYETTDKHHLFEHLQNLQFYILPLNGFNLTDELYIKMNARGKQLTNFENFKADLTKWMKDEANPYKEVFQNTVELDKRKMYYYLSISQKIDTKWAQFLVNISRKYDLKEKDEKGNLLNIGEKVDLLFIRLFYRYFLNKYILQHHSCENEKKEIIELSNEQIASERDFKMLHSEGKYQKFDAFSNVLKKENAAKDFECFIDVLVDNWADIESGSQPSWQDEKAKWSFFQNITQPGRVILLAISLFLARCPFDNIKFRQWMRVIWNLVENADIDNFATMIGVMKLIKELDEKSKDSENIYSFLANEKKQIESKYSEKAVKEERTKATFINANISWEKAFINAEKHPFFRGSVGFIMTEKMSIDDFMHRTEMASAVFDDKGINENYRKNGHLFLRALISEYTDYHEIIKQKNFTDKDEKEHYFKRMLTSNEIARNAMQEWFSLPNEQELEEVLNKAIQRDSQIDGWYENSEHEKVRIRRAHESLYKTPDLQRWMQQNEAFRFAWSGHLYISRPRSWYAWIMLDTNRNNIIYELFKKYNFEAQNQPPQVLDDNGNRYPIPYYWGGSISIEGNVNNEDYKLIFDNDRTLKIEIKKKDDNWEEVKSYDYVADENIIKMLEGEIFKG
ncbi:hypothetical protein EZS27_022563 [termite gut metagenome]|uniref:GmrSD restriction endonucleases N-terminal domain-containing protein n=1 Tax=termite gut metagenome TaxID=433724 RepID=A0A5J4R7C5_9ZZZZ